MVGNKKIVLITIGNFPFGGASANLLRLFTFALKEQMHPIEVLLPVGHFYGNAVDQKNKREGNIDGVKFKHLSYINHPKNLPGKILDNLGGIFLPVVYLIKKSFARELDIIIVYHTTLMSSLSITLISKIINKKIILILPEYYEKPNPRFISFSLLKWYSFFLSIRYVIKLADGYIVLSHYLERHVREILKSKMPVLIMPNLTDPEMFNATEVAPFLKNKITIGYAGNPTRKDGIEDLIKSFSVLNKKYPHTHLLIIGDITNGNSLIPILKKFADELGVLNNITFSGLVPSSKIPELLLSCQILTLTRPRGIFAEASFPTKLGEYFACKKPVVITRVGDIPRYFKNEEHVILVEPENIDSIVSGFEKLIMNPKLSKNLSENAYEWMNQNLNYKKVSVKISQFLNSIN